MSMLQHALSVLLSENPAHGVHVVYAKGRDGVFFSLALLLLLPSGNRFLCNWEYTWGFVNTSMAAVDARRNK